MTWFKALNDIWHDIWHLHSVAQWTSAKIFTNYLPRMRRYPARGVTWFSIEIYKETFLFKSSSLKPQALQPKYVAHDIVKKTSAMIAQLSSCDQNRPVQRVRGLFQ